MLEKILKLLTKIGPLRANPVIEITPDQEYDFKVVRLEHEDIYLFHSDFILYKTMHKMGMGRGSAMNSLLEAKYRKMV